jgi:hypothetical protein
MLARLAPWGLAVAIVFTASGCVKREIEITSDPAGAQVLLNGRDVGRTPAVVEFTFDGTYDIRLRLDGYDAVVGAGTTQAPVWDFVGADLVAEIWPSNLHRVDRWHFDLVPEKEAEAGLLERAQAMRSESAERVQAVEGAPPTRQSLQPAGAPASKPASGK